MNSYQRVMGTITGAPVDRPPVFAVLGAYGGRLTGTDLRTLYSNAAAYAAGQQALQAAFGFDLVMTGLDFSALAEAFGGEVAWSADQAPNVKRPPLRDAQAALATPYPDPARSGRLPAILEANLRLAEQYRERVPLVSILPGPGSFPALLIGMERWMELVLFEPEQASRLLEHTGGFLLSWAGALLEAGADCLVFTEGMAAAEILPREMFQERFLPHLTSVFAQIEAPKVVSSTGGSMNHTLDLLADLPGLIGVIAGSKDDLGQARQKLGPALTLIGNLDNLSLPVLSADQVQQQSLARLHRMARAGRFVLANSGGDVPQATPPENLKAMIAAAQGLTG